MIRLTIDVSLGILLAACVCCVVFILMENRRMRNCILTGARTKEAFADSPSKASSLPAAPLKKVDGSELEKYDFPDIESGFEAILEKMEDMKKTAMKFIEARDLANVVRKDKVTRIDTN
jgi:hypothetical protein